MKSQLFKELPSEELCLKVMSFFNLSDFNDGREFTRKNLEIFKTVEKMEEIKSEIISYYLNCKVEKFFKVLDEKKAITILRQLIRPYGYKIKSREKYFEGKKVLLYKMIKIVDELEPESKLSGVDYKSKVIEF